MTEVPGWLILLLCFFAGYGAPSFIADHFLGEKTRDR